MYATASLQSSLAGNSSSGAFALACQLLDNHPERRTATVRFLRADAYRRLGAAYLQQGKIIEAEAAYEQCAHTRLPRVANETIVGHHIAVRLEALCQLADIYEQRGKTQLAVQTRKHADLCRRHRDLQE
ncbi:hypothetical protein BDF22DRAFT_651945 [Syncephalis plumigaleata]|nr:hypothetical protein BDF22DRAFT_651945 [Syncephalis plumigaleata]